jgi:hypothetical protein
VGADAVLDRLAVDPQRPAFGVRIDADLAPIGSRVFPGDLGEPLLLAVGGDQPRLGPVRPVAGEAVASVGDDEKQLLGAGDVRLDLDRMARRLRSDDV